MSATSKRKKRLTAEDWELAALAAIEARGIEAVAVEPLARRLRVTKGSFYWHFRSVDDLLRAALKRWEERSTTLRRETFEKVLDPRERLRPLFADAASGSRGRYLSPRLFVAITAASDHPLVRPVLVRVTKNRLELLTKAFVELGHRRDSARRQALLLYSAYLGYLQLATHAPGALAFSGDSRAFVDHAFDTLVPPR